MTITGAAGSHWLDLWLAGPGVWPSVLLVLLVIKFKCFLPLTHTENYYVSLPNSNKKYERTRVKNRHISIFAKTRTKHSR
jgi:hypothetical protein